VRVTFVGSGDAFGSGGRFQTCILVEAGASRVLLDCGASSLIALKRLGIEPLDLDAVLLTHLHGDHFGGLPFLILDAQFRRRIRPLVVAGPPTVERRVRDAMDVFFPGSSQVARRFPVSYVELEDRRAATIAGVSVTPYEVVHASGAPPLALRVSAGDKVVAYSGDTEWTAALSEVARDADLFICEAYGFDKVVKYHLDYTTLMAHRDELACKQLVLTHMSPEMLDHAGDVKARCAHDGLTIDV
jgi:ribonuclease BN (tRNA processing enzyme)